MKKGIRWENEKGKGRRENKRKIGELEKSFKFFKVWKREQDGNMKGPGKGRRENKRKIGELEEKWGYEIQKKMFVKK